MRLLSLRARSVAAVVAGCVALVAPLQAQNVIDQEQPNGVISFATLDRWQAQTFTPVGSTVSGGGFLLSSRDIGAAQGTAQVSLWSGNPSITESQELATGTLAYVTGYDFTWFDAFWAPVAVTPGQAYWLVIGNGGWDVFTLSGTSPDDYPTGTGYYGAYSSVRDPYNDDLNTDLAFRTYTTAISTTAPEPGTWALLGTGLLGVGGLALRRRRATTA
jgi:hypothetical protein